MKIILADSSGFCLGVRLAVNKAEDAAQQNKRVYSLGPLIHNPHEVGRLTGMGVRVKRNLDGVVDGTVVIRAHGAPPRTYEELAARGVEVVDATCPFVSSLQRKAAALADDGYQVVIVGDPAHPEVAGVGEWAGGQALVVGNLEDVDNLPPLKRVGVVSQTTQREERVREIVSRLEARAEEVRYEPTICRATRERQEAARTLAARVPVMVVVGGIASSNTQKLASICRDAGAATYHVEEASELRREWFRGIETAGITAGASTPDWIVKEVIRRMEELARAGEEAAPKETTEGATEATEVPEAAGEPDPGENTATALEMKTPRRGQVLKGKVVEVHPDRLVVDVGYKSEGIVPAGEMGLWAGQDPKEVFSVGQEINVAVLGLAEPDGDPKLSLRRAREREAWKRIEKAHKNGEPVDGTVKEAVKGGLLLDVGIRAFMPASHVDLGYVPDLASLVGQSLPALVIEADRSERRVILSRKTLLEQERENARGKLLEELEVGQVRQGVVKGITDFGAFVDLGGMDGLLHVSEIAWHRVEHPSEVVSVGEEISVVILGLEREQGKISLGRKQVISDPWGNVEEKYPPDSWAAGQVSRIAPFGAFIQLEPGVEGLAHISQLAAHRVNDPREVLQEGEMVKVRVLRASCEERRVSLSLVAEEAREEAPRKLREKARGPKERKGSQPPREKRREQRQEVTAQSGSTERVTLGDLFGDLFEETRSRMNGK